MTETTLSQALRRVKAIKGELSETLERAQTSVSFKRGDEPAFIFSDEIEKASKLRKELIELESRIAYTNANTPIAYNGRPTILAWAVKEIRELKGQIAWFDGLKPYSRARETTTVSEREFDYETEKHVTKQTEWICKLPEAKRVEAVAALKDTFTRLNDIVETLNHRTTLLPIPSIER